MKHEVRAMQAQGAAASSISPHLWAQGRGRGLDLRRAPARRRRHHKSVALELAKSDSSGNAVGPGPTDTGMLTASLHAGEQGGPW